MDEQLPKVILDSTQMLLSLAGAVIVAVIVDYIFLIPIAVLAIVFNYVRKIYLKSSKDLKRLDGISEYSLFTTDCLSKRDFPSFTAQLDHPSSPT